MTLYGSYHWGKNSISGSLLSLKMFVVETRSEEVTLTLSPQNLEWKEQMKGWMLNASGGQWGWFEKSYSPRLFLRCFGLCSTLTYTHYFTHGWLEVTALLQSLQVQNFITGSLSSPSKFTLNKVHTGFGSVKASVSHTFFTMVGYAAILKGIKLY